MKKLLLFVLISTFVSAQKTIRLDAELINYGAAVNQDSLRATLEKLVSFKTRHTLSALNHKTEGIGAARNYVLNKFKSYAKNAPGRMEVYLQDQTIEPDGRRVTKQTNLANVVAVLKGTSKIDNRIIIVGAHLDSRASDVNNFTTEAPGANDDGSGVAAVIEAARILSKSSFPNTIIFVAFSGEEQGLLGSKLMAKIAQEENWDIAAMLNNDMIGNIIASGTGQLSGDKLRVFSEGLTFYDLANNAPQIRALGLENDSPSRLLARYLKDVVEMYMPDLEIRMIYRNDRFLRGGDHTPFVENGFAAVRLTEYNENFNSQHQNIRKENGIEYGDVLSGVNFHYLNKNTRANIFAIASLAKSPSPARKVTLSVKELSNFTNLSWEPSEEKRETGYYVLIRETDQSAWQQRFYVKGTSITIPYSKDNYFFAVQSVDAMGNGSLPVTPTVGR